MTPWTDQADHRSWLTRERLRLLEFGRDVVAPAGGAAWLDEHGVPALDRGVQTWITARTVHTFGLGAMLGVPGSARIARGALAGLTGLLRDGEHGGWLAHVDADGTPVDDSKQCYQHAFVVLAASTATAAGLSGGQELLDEATAVFLERFWDEDAGMCVDAWDRTFTELDGYRGVNGNMHAVEAMLAAGDVTGDRAWYARARRIARRVAENAAAHEWRIPEHYDAAWTPELDLNRERPDDPFKPFGATVGHGFEWSRLFLHIDASLGTDELLPAARNLFDRAQHDGWSVDGAEGFVYTTDWEGAPVVRDRMHWVAAEAAAAAATLHTRTGEEHYAQAYATWWDNIADTLVDRENGSWHHQLDPANSPVATVWPGKPDLYHAVQSTLLPVAPLSPGLAVAARDGLIGARTAEAGR
ncbi:Mannose or cellobiose epimerase, N-acyl-D-glucosamine 2-epimerase family [Paraoerskovia marina]|uniref:Mannose or cellobiose epimerase, N-acyl-D-glucosamine 2-epimerase family n=1 Tax=Paraoerskovia marina TaxID=545619 RepID=A0A1H1MNG9_9CELL|nr:AGE family epimerase/isomerase [Paraoerskovia marina]SDR88162.1 Mannose or cellobiose epimerase, N-acyl-D-glucosamine 2-epimerase family [Paraoerskovia marina]